MKTTKTYGLFTTVTMIVGIVIGSGIYFKADDILQYTHGNLFLGLLVLVLGSVCIVFGSLTLSQLSKRCDDRGGIVAYFEQFMSPKFASGFGWFQLFVYTPTITSVIAWVSAMYTFMLFGINATFLQQILLGLLYVVILLLINTFNKKLGGYLQNIATILKLIPLLLIAVYGIFFAPSVNLISLHQTGFIKEFTNLGWLAALVPMAFSYDGWTIALNISSEVKNSKVNVPKALILGPILILASYLLYIFGIAKILGTDTILKLGDSAIFEAGKSILGERFGNIILVVIVISVLGVLNGIILGGIRMPQALAEKKMMSDNEVSKINDKYGVSIKSTILFFCLILFWTTLHFLVTEFNLLNGRDISEISIVFSYLIYILLYYAVFKILHKENKKLVFLPFFATIGSLMIFIGSIITSPVYVPLYILFCTFVTYLGYRYYA